MPSVPPPARTRRPATPPQVERKAAEPGRGTAGASSTPAQRNGALQGATAKQASQQRFDQMAVRTKLKVSEPGDASEREADAVADQIMRMPADAAMIPAAAAAPRPRGLPLQRKPAAGLSMPRQLARAAMSPPVSPATHEQVIKRKVTSADFKDDEGATEVDAKHENATGGPAFVEDGLIDRVGTGMPLDPATRSFFEQRMHIDLGQVLIHTTPAAAREAEMLAARAFTVGRHIAFAEGEYQPQTFEGKHLLAHELAHVAQQSGDAADVMRCEDAPAMGGAAATTTGNCFSVPSGVPIYGGTTLCTDTKTFELPMLALPALKSRNAHLIPEPLQVAPLGRPRTYQGPNWRRAVRASAQTQLDQLTTAARAEGAVHTSNNRETLFLTLRQDPRTPIFGDAKTLRKRLRIPFWDQHSALTNFQIDHVREMQLCGRDEEQNYELLEGNANMTAGDAIDDEITSKMRGGLRALRDANPTVTVLPEPGDWRTVRNEYQVRFRQREWTLGHTGASTGGSYWSLQRVLNGAHAALLRPMRAEERAAVGQPNMPDVFLSIAGGVKAPALVHPRENWLPRVDLINWETPSPSHTDPAVLGRLTVGVFKAGTNRTPGNGVAVPPDYPDQSWRVMRVPGLNAGYINPADVGAVRNSLRLPGMSPIELESLELTREGLRGEGRVLPTVPLIADADIRIRIDGREAQIYKTFDMDELDLPAPFEMQSCNLTVFFGSASGLGIEGRADFAVDGLGSGFLGATATTSAGFALAGGFDFDSDLFDRARVSMAYRDHQLSLAGEIGIDSPDKIRGIRAANLRIEYQAGEFSATGSVDPDIRGVRRAGLRVRYGEEAGLVIGGSLELEANPLIRSGSVDVTVSKREDAWRVAAEGTAQPAIPGIDSTLSVSYDDGAFDARFGGSFARGMLSGTVEVGATNRQIDAAGRPTGPAEPGAPVIVYGSGSATLRIAPWLQGTAGIRLAPNGEVTVTGEIGLPGTLEIFPRQQIDKPLFALATQIPIFPGIVAEVGGNLAASAGFGPGVLDRCRIGVEYNPAHEENTHVTGDAHFNVPADAGLRLGARAGVGLGITGASATGGLEVGGTLGIAGAAEAGVHIDWMPSRGLTIEAEAAIHAQPRFKFDVSGYVSVQALGFSIYEQRWQLAAYELGSDVRFGVRFPLHYQEGEPFTVSLDDVEFEVPEVDPGQLLAQLGGEIF